MGKHNGSGIGSGIQSSDRALSQSPGMTQQEVAASARITRDSMLERNEYRPTVEMLLQVCEAMGIEAWRIVRMVEVGRRPQGRKARLGIAGRGR
jgi:hypothetical protein